MLSNTRYRRFTPLLAMTAAAVVGCATTASGPDKSQRATATQPAADGSTAPYVPTEAELQQALLLAQVNNGVRVGTPELIPKLPGGPRAQPTTELERALLARLKSGVWVETPELVLELRGGPRARNNDGETTLHWAARERPEWVGRLLDLGCELEARDVRGRTPLHEALFTGHDDAARVLIKRGADVKAVDAYGATTVILAARLCQAELVRELLDDGIDPNPRSSPGASALIWALLRDDDFGVAKLLISRGADVNVKDALGHSVLHWVCAFGSARAAEYLIERGVAPNTVDREGITPLHVAAWRGRPELARLLVAAGADPNARTTDGETPLDWARSHQNSETEAELARLGGAAGDKPKEPVQATEPEQR